VITQSFSLQPADRRMFAIGLGSSSVARWPISRVAICTQTSDHVADVIDSTSAKDVPNQIEDDSYGSTGTASVSRSVVHRRGPAVDRALVHFEAPLLELLSNVSVAELIAQALAQRLHDHRLKMSPSNHF
jgi:hypothetical protein